jgi:uncharacterized protein YndB with AHSA1/START domain
MTATRTTTITAEPGTPFLEVVRDFDATREQLWRAATDPELVVRWLGPRETAMVLDRWDVRAGGEYRYVITSRGVEQGFRGVYHQVLENELIIQTFEWEGATNEVCLETATYRDVGGRVRLTTRSVFPSIEAREQALANGMERGIVDSMQRLDELLAET